MNPEKRKCVPDKPRLKRTAKRRDAEATGRSGGTPAPLHILDLTVGSSTNNFH